MEGNDRFVFAFAVCASAQRRYQVVMSVTEIDRAAAKALAEAHVRKPAALPLCGFSQLKASRFWTNHDRATIRLGVLLRLATWSPESRDPSRALAGNAPVLVTRDGAVHVTGTAHPIEHYLSIFERTGHVHPAEGHRWPPRTSWNRRKSCGGDAAEVLVDRRIAPVRRADFLIPKEEPLSYAYLGLFSFVAIALALVVCWEIWTLRTALSRGGSAILPSSVHARVPPRSSRCTRRGRSCGITFTSKFRCVVLDAHDDRRLITEWRKSFAFSQSVAALPSRVAIVRRDEWFGRKWLYLKRFAFLAGVGGVLIVFGVSADSGWLSAPGVLLIIPLIFWLVLVPLFHWKDRYQGDRSGLWGAVLLIETSGWFKIVYLLRHVIPDWRKSGRYQNVD